MYDLKRIVCLANSRKLHGRCVAGREWSDHRVGSWIRPVSDREHGEVSEYERQYEDGSDPQVLDVMDVPVLEARPVGCQTENWLLDPQRYWEKVGRLSWLELPLLADTDTSLWVDGHSTYNGVHDKIPIETAQRLENSLRLIRVDKLGLSVFKPDEAFGNMKRRVQGRFVYGGKHYGLWVTDPTYERRYLAKLDGNYRIGECYLTVSLGEPYGGACYKLIASIFVP